MALAQESKEEELEDTLKTPFQHIHALHFEELAKLWEADRRIPSVNSRRAWAEARNLKPHNVHNWWYRRRPLARKLKIKIPRETYELDVGTPPIIEEVSKEQNTEKCDSPDTDSTIPVDMRSSLSGTEFVTSSETCGSEVHIFAKNPLFEELSAEMDAYTRPSTPAQSSELELLMVTSLYSTPTCGRSPLPRSLPPSSPPLWSPALLKSEDMSIDEEMDHCRIPPESLPDASLIVKGCSSISYMPLPSFDRLGSLEELELENNSDNWIPLPADATWCLRGCRLTYEGCCIGICSCAFLTF